MNLRVHQIVCRGETVITVGGAESGEVFRVRVSVGEEEIEEYQVEELDCFYGPCGEVFFHEQAQILITQSVVFIIPSVGFRGNPAQGGKIFLLNPAAVGGDVIAFYQVGDIPFFGETESAFRRFYSENLIRYLHGQMLVCRAAAPVFEVGYGWFEDISPALSLAGKTEPAAVYQDGILALRS